MVKARIQARQEEQEKQQEKERKRVEEESSSAKASADRKKREEKKKPQVRPIPRKILTQLAKEREARKPKKPSRWIKPTIAAGTTLLIAGALYTGLKWYQRRRIARTLARHDLKLTMLTPTQKDALAAAFLAGHRVPGSLRKLARLTLKEGFESSNVPHMTMWELLTELYHGKTATLQLLYDLRNNVGLIAKTLD